MFITFEGPDGSGKTTTLEALKKFLKDQGVDFVFTREPGSEKMKETQAIRKIILDPNNNITPMAEAILYAADRRLHLEKIIWPALKENKIVLCDRYLDSSLAYQGAGRQLGIDKILVLQEIATEKTFPDLTIFFDIKPEESYKRFNKRHFKDRLELEGKDFHERVYEGYKVIAKKFANRFKIIDAGKTKDEVFQEVKKSILKAIKND